MSVNALLWSLIGFLSGAIPFSVLIGKAVLHVDIRRFGDGNPGGTNVIRAGGRWWGALAIVLDYFKGAAPVGLAHLMGGVEGWPMAVVGVAPVLGHAYSPFLSFRGGKAVAVTFGVWTGLTLWVGPTLLGLSLGLWVALLASDAWAVMFSMAGLLAYLISTHTDMPIMGAWMANTVVLFWKHRTDLAHRPKFRQWLRRLVRQ